MEQIQRKTRRLELVLGPEDGGVKVDTLLRRRLHLSGTVIRRIKWLPDGILVDGARVNTAFRPREGQTLSVRLSDPERRSDILPTPGPLDIVYEDGDLLILNKAPGVPVHPGPGHFNDTIGNFLLNYYDSEGIEGDFHPVHRLDRGTSGLMAVAKHPHAQEVLKRQLHTPDFQRTYLAVCVGTPAPPSGTIDTPLGPCEGSLVEQTVRPDGKHACTHYETLRQNGPFALLRLQLETGRTHQIRAHLAAAGYPIIGDAKYGNFAENRKIALKYDLTTQFLHAYMLKFYEAESVVSYIKGREIRAALPQNYKRIVIDLFGKAEPVRKYAEI